MANLFAKDSMSQPAALIRNSDRRVLSPEPTTPRFEHRAMFNRNASTTHPSTPSIYLLLQPNSPGSPASLRAQVVLPQYRDQAAVACWVDSITGTNGAIFHNENGAPVPFWQAATLSQSIFSHGGSGQMQNEAQELALTTPHIFAEVDDQDSTSSLDVECHRYRMLPANATVEPQPRVTIPEVEIVEELNDIRDGTVEAAKAQVQENVSEESGAMENIKILEVEEAKRVKYFEIRQSPKGGFGAVALVDIPADTVIHVEPTLLRAGHNEILREFYALPEESKMALMSLHNFSARHPNEIISTFYTNRFSLKLGVCAVYAIACRFNHACKPICRYMFKPITDDIQLTTSRDVKAGTELTVSYGRLPPDEMQESYGFVCDCGECPPSRRGANGAEIGEYQIPKKNDYYPKWKDAGNW